MVGHHLFFLVESCEDWCGFERGLPGKIWMGVTVVAGDAAASRK